MLQCSVFQQLFEFIPPADVLKIINEEARRAGFRYMYKAGIKKTATATYFIFHSLLL